MVIDRGIFRAEEALVQSGKTAATSATMGTRIGAYRRFVSQSVRIWGHSNRKWLVPITALLAVVVLFGAYSLAASPYSSDSFVQAPFTTRFSNGQVVLTKHFNLRVYHNWGMSTVGYLEQLATDVWDRIRSPKEPAGNLASIIASIHTQRFDPSKPYIISGDQFDGLYLRNLSVFYQSLLDPHTALNATDWHNRQRLAVQSLAYALSATQVLKCPVTTLLPISPRGVIAVNFWSYPSDTIFSLFELLQRLENDPATRQAALQLQHEYGSGLQAAYQNYLHTVRDPRTEQVRYGLQLSSARDAAKRQSSFYDNVILWRTEQLADQLGFGTTSSQTLARLRQAILQRFWNNSEGHFIDDTAPGNQNSYSSDWLIALPVGFLDPSNPDDLTKLKRVSAYIDQRHLASPLPIRYTSDADTTHQDFFVRYFVGNYGNTAIWSYWGNLYIGLETSLYQQTGQPLYARHVTASLAAWRRVILRDRGYPETLDGHGRLLETTFYESIRRNGWIVDYETAQYNWDQAAKVHQL